MANEQPPYYMRDESEGGGNVGNTPSLFRSFLLYGKFGTGKTRAAYSLCDKPLGISLDKGESGIDPSIPRERFFYKKRIYRPLLGILTDARNRTGPWFEPGGKYADRQTIVIETGTELDEYVMYELMALDRTTDKGGNIIQWAPEDRAPAWAHWDTLATRMEDLGRAIRDLKETKMNVVMTALSQADNDSSGNPIDGYPMFAGKKTRQLISAWFDEVYYMTKERVGVSGAKYVAYPYDYGIYQAKSRLDLKRPIENLNKENLEKAIQASKPQTPSQSVPGGAPATTQTNP